MTLQKIESNIRELETRLKTAEGHSAMVLRNCLTTMNMKRKEVKRDMRNAKREEGDAG